MNSTFKKNVAVIVLVAFSVLVLSGFGAAVHESGKQMMGDCPFSTAGVAICPQDVLSVALHHISAYNSFFNVPTSFGLMILVLSVLLMVAALFVVFLWPPLLKQQFPVRILRDPPSVNSYDKKIIHWLSLFENSPSLL